MPTQSNRIPDEILEEPAAFTVINTDNFGIFGKPNAIVRPLRRRDPLEGTTATNNNNNNYNHQNLNISNNNNFNNNINNNNINNHESHNGETQLLKSSAKQHHQSFDYSKEMEQNLKKLQRDKSTKNTTLPMIQQKRPLFITTVPKGVFLQPIKEIKDIPIVQTRVYAFMSHPRILHNFNNNDDIHTSLSNNNNSINNNNNSKDTQLYTSRIVNGFGTIASGVAGFKVGKYREQSQTYQNVMYEKRVVRGSNYSTTHITSGEGDGLSKESEAQRRQILRKKAMSRTQRGIIGTPPPVRGRKHERVQTEKYLEELFARPPEFDVSCQTDLFLHRPPSPPYICSKTGCDVSTEIVDGDLFDFDTEVQSILEALIGKTVEQGLVEVLQEEELSDMREQKQKYLAIREAEMAELKRLEEQEKRLQAEKDRRLHQDVIAKELDREMQQRVTAAKLLQGHIAHLLPGVLNNIEPLTQAENREELERQLGPWLAQEVAEEVGQMIDSRDLLEEIVREILRERAEIYRAMMNSESGESVTVPEEEATGEEEEEELGFEDDDLSESGKDL